MQQKTTANVSHNNKTGLENSQGRDVADNNDQDDTMFNDDDDDDLDISEIDKVLQGEKTPLTSQKTGEKNSKVKNHNSTKTEQKSTSQRYLYDFIV